MTGAVTTSVTFVLLVSEPLVPLTVTVYVPVGVEVVVATASVDDPEPVTDVGVNDAVAPVGKPMTPSVTAPLKPLIAETVVVYDAPVPADTVFELGVAESEKSVTVTVRVAAALVAPALSVTASDAV